MPGENTTWVHRWFDEVWNRGDANAIDNLMAADAVMHGLGEAGRDTAASAPFKGSVLTALGTVGSYGCVPTSRGGR